MDTELAEFIETSFGSVWALETMLFLRRQPSRSWTSAELVEQLRSSEAIVAQVVERLVAAGLVIVDDADRVRYAPASKDLEDLSASLEAEYGRAPAAVRRMIIQTPLDKLKTFADAFKVTKP